jgi:hypothetical protein
MMLNDIFERARERVGGRDEAELIYRFPDLRLWKAYTAELMPLLARKCDFGSLSTTTDLTFPAGTAVQNLGRGDLELLGVYLVQADGTLTELTPESRSDLAAKHQDLTASGSPEACYLTGDGKGTMQLGLWPVPDVAVTVRLKGKGLAFSEFVYDESTGAWKDTATPPATAFTSAGLLAKRYASYLPDLFLPAAADYLAMAMVESMEEYIERPAILQRYEAKWAASLMKCAGDWHMTLPNIVLEQKGHVRRVHYSCTCENDGGY